MACDNSKCICLNCTNERCACDGDKQCVCEPEAVSCCCNK
mgnify:FL=1